MNAPLTWIPIDGGLAVHGRIDEHAELAHLADALREAGARLDLGGLTRINSIGVREWMDFVRAWEGPLTLIRCAPAFVDQLNAIANFAGRATIASVLTAYECDADGTVTNVEVSTSEARAGKKPSAPLCQSCQRTMLPAVEDELYYRFLRYVR